MKNKIYLLLCSLWTLTLLTSCGSVQTQMKSSFLEERQLESIHRDIRRLLKKTENLSAYKMKSVTIL